MAKENALMAKRGNGAGSIYHRKSDNKWVGSITLENGKRKVFYGKTQKEVQDKVNEALYEQQQGTLITAKDQTLSEYLAGWLEDTVKPNRRPRTYERYECMIRLHINPVLGKVKLQALTPRHIKLLQTQGLKAGLSNTTVGAIHEMLHKALDDAWKLELIKRNVCDMISPPRRQHKEYQPLDAAQSRKLLEAAKGHPQEVMFVLALATGMRRGELLGLKWQDIDFSNRVLYVRRALSRLPTKMGKEEGDLYVEADLKTKSSKRTIALAGFAIDALKQHRSKQGEMREQAGRLWQEHNYVFCKPNGAHLNPGHDVLVQLKILLKKAGLPDVRFHDLRHSVATFLLSMGVHPKIVQDILGHAEISMTLDTYSHVSPTMQREAMDKLDKMFEEWDKKPEDGEESEGKSEA
jgi:integrase